MLIVVDIVFTSAFRHADAKALTRDAYAYATDVAFALMPY